MPTYPKEYGHAVAWPALPEQAVSDQKTCAAAAQLFASAPSGAAADAGRTGPLPCSWPWSRRPVPESRRLG